MSKSTFFSKGVPPYNLISYDLFSIGPPSAVKRGSSPHPQDISTNSLSSSFHWQTKHNSNKTDNRTSTSSTRRKHVLSSSFGKRSDALVENFQVLSASAEYTPSNE